MPTGRNIIRSSAYGLGFKVPLDPGPTSLEVSQHPDNRMYAWGLEGTGSAEGPSSGLPRGQNSTVLRPGQARARPAEEAWGWVCVGRGRRGERHPPKPAGKAQEGCHPLTRSSDLPPLLPGWARAAAKISSSISPTFKTHQGLPSHPPGQTVHSQLWPQALPVLGDSAHQSLERQPSSHLRSRREKKYKTKHQKKNPKNKKACLLVHWHRTEPTAP